MQFVGITILKGLIKYAVMCDSKEFQILVFKRMLVTNPFLFFIVKV